MTRKIFALVICILTSISSFAQIPNNEIWYTTTDGRKLDELITEFADYLVSHTYRNGKGVFKFSRDVIRIGDPGPLGIEDEAELEAHWKSLDYHMALAFDYYNMTLKTVTLPNSITWIYDDAFSGCKNLISINIPNSVTEIGANAFKDCTSLTSITIPNSVTEIDGTAFDGCTKLKEFKGKYASADGRCLIINGVLEAFISTGLTSYTIPYGVTKIDNDAFSGCTNLNSITIPDSVTKIGWWAFSDCTSLTSITIPDSVTEIGLCAFRGCTGLTSINIPDSVTEIGGYAFEDCTSLKSITIPNSVTEIGREAFRGCTSLTNITIPDSATKIGEYAFLGCTSLKSITIPDSVTVIGHRAFWRCTSLTNITIPDSVTEIGRGPFEACNIEQITISAVTGNIFRGCDGLDPSKVVAYTGKYASEDGRCLIKDGVLIDYIHNGAERYEIPNGVTIISDEVFKGCSSLKEITIPNSVTMIGEGAFDGCNIERITINAVTGNIFRGYDGLDPSKVVAYTGKYASEDGRCLIKDGVLIDYIHNGAEGYEIPNGVTIIGDEVFKGCSSLKSITIPESVTSIGSSALENCTSLTSINIPNSVTKIGWHTFWGCTSLTSINIPNSVTMIGNSLFYGCTGLTSINIPNSVTKIGEGAFYYCTSLTSITIPNSGIEIEENSFDGCNIERITINAVTGNIFRGCGGLDPSKVVAYTGEYASDDGRCLIKDGVLIDFIVSNLTSYAIPEGVRVINPEVFSHCYILTDITIPATVTQIGDNVFAGGSPWLSITCLSTTPPQATTLGISEKATIYVPKKSVSAYKKAEGWTNYKKQIKRIKE